jgi:hypothetical protein
MFLNNLAELCSSASENLWCLTHYLQKNFLCQDRTYCTQFLCSFRSEQNFQFKNNRLNKPRPQAKPSKNHKVQQFKMHHVWGCLTARIKIPGIS